MSQPIKIAAQLRAAISEIIAHAKEPVIAAELVSDPRISIFQVVDQKVHQAVHELYKNGAIRRVYVNRPDSPQTRYGYEANNGSRQEPAPAVARELIKLPPEVKLTVVKSSGNLRLEFRGLTIEIGVTE